MLIGPGCLAPCQRSLGLLPKPAHPSDLALAAHVWAAFGYEIIMVAVSFGTLSPATRTTARCVHLQCVYITSCKLRVSKHNTQPTSSTAWIDHKSCANSDSFEKWPQANLPYKRTAACTSALLCKPYVTQPWHNCLLLCFRCCLHIHRFIGRGVGPTCARYTRNRCGCPAPLVWRVVNVAQHIALRDIRSAKMY